MFLFLTQCFKTPQLLKKPQQTKHVDLPILILRIQYEYH